MKVYQVALTMECAGVKI